MTAAASDGLAPTSRHPRRGFIQASRPGWTRSPPLKPSPTNRDYRMKPRNRAKQGSIESAQNLAFPRQILPNIEDAHNFAPRHMADFIPLTPKGGTLEEIWETCGTLTRLVVLRRQPPVFQAILDVSIRKYREICWS